jgi:hypothetical protein
MEGSKLIILISFFDKDLFLKDSMQYVDLPEPAGPIII